MNKMNTLIAQTWKKTTVVFCAFCLVLGIGVLNPALAWYMELILGNHGSGLVNGSGLDVGAPVPVPGALWLLCSGLVGLAGIRRKRNG